MKYGKFIADGREYQIDCPKTPSEWTNYLFNDRYKLNVSQTLQGKGLTVCDYNQTEEMSGERFFYIVDKDRNEVFNPNYYPLHSELEDYHVFHGMERTELTSKRNGLCTRILVFVPNNFGNEIWKLTIKNESSSRRNLSLFTAFGIYDHGVMGGRCFCGKEGYIDKYSFPYHTLYEDKEKVEKKASHLFVIWNKQPISVDTSKRAFFGSDDITGIPLAVENRGCNGRVAIAEPFVAAMEHGFCLEAGQEESIYFIVGKAHTEAEIINLKSIFSADLCEEEYRKVKATWSDILNAYYMDSDDKDINAYFNFWLKKQIVFMTRLNRGGTYCPVRNQLQDALGYSFINAEEAMKYIFDVMKLQKATGSLQQWHTTDGSAKKALCYLNHTDAPLWLIICTIVAIDQTEDLSFYDRMIGFEDAEEKSVKEHLLLASRFMYRMRGDHGLCLIGDGDWNDPVNGVGRKGKGESSWSTFALIFALGKMIESMQSVLTKEEITELEQNREELIEIMNTVAWDCDRFVAGFDDDKVAYGSKADKDRVFLNAQTWAILSGACDKERMDILCNTMKRLETPFGPKLIDPAFDEWDERWGRISVKMKGTTENGSVYCHASMFKAYADAIRGDKDALYETIKRTLPTNTDNDNNIQFPGFLCNYYCSDFSEGNYGRSSCHYETGTVSWMILVIYEFILGMRRRDCKIQKFSPLAAKELGKVSIRLRDRE